ncbi:hypothetical protein G7046_g2084 [Stylonectria norvegica]|nr:hypothetical protein G7046_g2084 [Stylonectria norvegica]
MDFLIKFAHVHETFRRPEIEALAIVEGIEMTIIDYSIDVGLPPVLASPTRAYVLKLKLDSLPFVLFDYPQSIHELWGSGNTLEELHQSVRQVSSHLWPQYKTPTFKFDIDSFRGTRSNTKRLKIINSFQFMAFEGRVRMSNPDESFTLFELWPLDSIPLGLEEPTTTYLGRYLGGSSRDLSLKFDLKKREYISTTSMDSELALITANIALAAPGKLFYDPFVGTGSFPVACAQFGALAWGSDIDGRSMRGEGGKKSLLGNFQQYGLGPCLGGVFAADLTNSPIRSRPTWDGIVCDPPYGVREGLRVLGCRDPENMPWLIEAGKKNGMHPSYVPPKKPYSFLAMLDDILVFAAETLVSDGRLSFWMPTANDEEQEISVPNHPSLEIVAVCTQPFNKWSRRLITYRRIPDAEVSPRDLEAYATRKTIVNNGTSVDELNPFRRGYFKKFETGE